MDSLSLLVNYYFFCDSLQPNTQKLELAAITTETPDIGTCQVSSKKVCLYSRTEASCSVAVLALSILRNPELPTPSSFD